MDSASRGFKKDMEMKRSTSAGVVVAMAASGTSHAQNPASSDGSAIAALAAPLPKDVYPDSRNRLPLPKREDMDAAGQKIFDQMTRHSQLAVGAENPSPRLYDPQLAKPLDEAGHYLKYETGLPNPLMEIAVLTTAREMDCQYEWTQWETHGRDPKDPRFIEPAIIDIIKYDKPVAGLGEKETAIIALGREMLGEKKVSSAIFAEVLRLFGRRLTVDLVELMTGYSACAAEMPAIDQQLLAGQKPLLPAGRLHPHNPVRSSAVAPAATPLPKDVYPDSRNRLPLPKRDDPDDYGKQVFDEMTRESELPGGLEQPSFRLWDPQLAKPMGEAHHYVNYETGLPAPLVEIAALVTARERDCQYEWTQLETHGRSPNDPRHIEPAIIDIIKYDKPAVGLGEKETAVIRFGREMFAEETVSSATFAEVLRLFGRRGTMDLIEVMTLYSTEAAGLAAFDQQLPEGQKPLLPPR
jgi:4-carboxymuconolactone decarboxylase